MILKWKKILKTKTLLEEEAKVTAILIEKANKTNNIIR